MVSGKDSIRNPLGVIPGREGPFEVDMTRFTARQSRNTRFKIPDSRKESPQNNGVSKTSATEQLSEWLRGASGEARPTHAAIAWMERQELSGGIRVSIGLFLVCVISYWPTLAAAEWPRPQLVPLPVYVQGVSKAVLSLDGAWKFTLSPPNEFWLNSSDPSAWPDVSVPGELVMQGFGISRDVEYAYKRRVVIPSIAMACTSRKRLPGGRGGKSSVQYG